MADALDYLARRAAADPAFLGQALDEYARSEALNDDALAAALHCGPETLPRLRLCLRPRPEPELFRGDIEEIASHFGVAAEVLVEAVRRSDALTALRQAPTARGTLLAARDRQPESGDQGSEP